MTPIRIEAVRAALPAGFVALQVAAREEGFCFLDRLAEEWRTGQTRFDRPGEVLMAAFMDGALCGIGGLTHDPAVSEALRMRRFYVLSPARRCGVGRALVRALLSSLPRRQVLVTVNAGTPDAPAFWQAAGFVPVTDAGLGHTHVVHTPPMPQALSPPA